MADGKDISILSIASGSARAVIESINGLTPVAGQKISAVFLDKNPHALEYSKQSAQEYSLINRKDFSLSWINGTAETFLNSVIQNQFNVIEMVGLLDYFNDAKATSVFSKVRGILESGGLFITANICDNPERVFMTRTIQWNMIYRSAEDLGNLLKNAGFADDEIRLYYEPLHVHVVAAMTKK
jgi:cyclopropane fatty-acyl-phospholipid synthase-like methyltransferase